MKADDTLTQRLRDAVMKVRPSRPNGQTGNMDEWTCDRIIEAVLAALPSAPPTCATCHHYKENFRHGFCFQWGSTHIPRDGFCFEHEPVHEPVDD